MYEKIIASDTRQSSRLRPWLAGGAVLVLLGNACVFLLVCGLAILGYPPNVEMLGLLAVVSGSSFGPLLALVALWRGWSMGTATGLLFLGLLWIVYAYGLSLIIARSNPVLVVTLPLPRGNELGQTELEYAESVDLFGTTTSPVFTFYTDESPTNVEVLYSRALPLQGLALTEASHGHVTSLEFTRNSCTLSIQIEPSGHGSWVVIGPG